MLVIRRWLPIVLLTVVCAFIALLSRTNYSTLIRGHDFEEVEPKNDTLMGGTPVAGLAMNTTCSQSSLDLARPSTDQDSGRYCTPTLVVPRMKDDDISWMDELTGSLHFDIYIADDFAAAAHPPTNKGHEVMIYLTYIIDHYDKLPEAVIFMHAHRRTHHNNDLLDFDAVEMIKRLRMDHVLKQGYFNMRCGWLPGCPQWLDASGGHEVMNKQEQAVLSESWQELFPLDPLPPNLAQPCCSQFAVSRQRIQSIPRSRYIFWRDWVMKTPLTNYVSGRIWEYSWHYLFTRESVLCPAEHVCYCDGFGLCFESQEVYRTFRELNSTQKENVLRSKEFDSH